MYIIPIAWSYVAVMIAATEDSFFRGIIALLLWGVLPVGLFMFFAGSPGRRRKRALEQALIDEKNTIESAKLESPVDRLGSEGNDKNSDTKNTL
jgi:hypothetical protein